MKRTSKMKLFKVKPRQTGKTTDLINKAISYANEGKRVLFIVASEKDKSYLYPKMYLLTHKIFMATQDLKEDDILGSFFNVVIIDEYLYFSERNQSRIYNILEYLRYSDIDIHISSTSRKLIDKNMFDLVKEIKKSNLKLGILYKNLSVDKREEFDYLYNNLITEPDFQLDCSFDIQDYYLNKEQFEIEILGRLFK